MLRMAASVRNPDRKPWAENSPAFSPAISTRCLMIALTDCGSIARFETVPHRPIPRNTLPLSTFAAVIQAFSASTGRPVR